MVVERIMFAKTDMKVIGYLYRKQKLKQKQKKKNHIIPYKIKKEDRPKNGKLINKASKVNPPQKNEKAIYWMWEVFANNISNKAWICKIYKNSYNSIAKYQTPQLKNEQRT